MYFRIVSGIEHVLSEALANVSVACYRNPRITIGIFLAFVAAMAAGVSQATIEVEVEVLWTDPNSIPANDGDFVFDRFGDLGDFATTIVTSPDRSTTTNILTLAVITELFSLHDEIVSFQTGSTEVSFADLCTRIASGDCLIQSPLRHWNFNSSLFLSTVTSDEDVQTVLGSPTFPDGIPVETGDFFSNYEVVNGSATASAITMAYFIGSTFDGSEETPTEWLEGFTTLTNEDYQAANPGSGFKLVGMTQQAFDAGLSESVFGDIILLVIAYNLMIIFASVTLGPAFSLIHGRKLLVFADVLALLFAGFAGYGLMFWIGIPFQSLAQIAPFILLGIGIDNAYVIAGAFDRTNPEQSLEDRIRETMRTAGMSITATTLTSFCALMFGSITKLPAITWFCYYTGTALLFIYFQHCTVFIVMLSWDEQRKLARRKDVAPCLKFSEEADLNKPRTESQLEYFLYEWFGKILLRDEVRLLVILLVLGVGAGAVVMVLDIPNEFRLQDLVRDTSFQGDYFRTNEDFYNRNFLGTAPSVYTKSIDFSDEQVNKEITRITNEVAASEYIDTTNVDVTWHANFHTWATSTFPDSVSEDGLYYNGTDVVDKIKQFLTVGAFRRYQPKIVFGKNNTEIIATQMTYKHIILPSAQERIITLLAMQAITTGSSLGSDIFIHSPEYIFFDQFRIIQPEMVTSLALALVAVIVVSLVMLVNPISVLIITVVIASTFLWLLASIPIWGLDLNTISAVNLIMAIGLVVDYSLHFIHCFGLKPNDLGRKKRTLEAIKDIGPAVFLGLCTTFLGVLPLAFASSGVFRVFFQIFVGIVLVGGFHGFFLVPVLLSLIGPDSGLSIAGSNEVKVKSEETVKVLNSP